MMNLNATSSCNKRSASSPSLSSASQEEEEEESPLKSSSASKEEATPTTPSKKPKESKPILGNMTSNKATSALPSSSVQKLKGEFNLPGEFPTFKLEPPTGAAPQLLEKNRERVRYTSYGTEIDYGSLKFYDQETLSVPVDIKENDVVSIKRNDTEDLHSVPFFFRKHLMDQLDELKKFVGHSNIWKLYVTGAPGCGKTCFFCVWADLLRQSGKRVLFIQYQQRRGCQVWVLEGNSSKFLTGVTAYNLVSVTKALLEGMTQERDLDVCILDSVRDDEICGELLGLLDHLSGTKIDTVISKLVLITSLKFEIRNGDEFSTAAHEYVKKMSFDSWTMADYEMAAQSGLVKGESWIRSILLGDWRASSSGLQIMSDEQKILEVMREKYDYAGGCVRYMFEMSMKELSMELKDRCDGVSNWAAFARTGMDLQTWKSVYNLMQSFSNSNGRSMCAPVSKYVLRRAYEKCGNKLTEAVKSVANATGNPVLIDWALELSQLDVIDKERR